jgi:murein DD-endopeptidase MepM/ murein hydrolase activator NlpD
MADMRARLRLIAVPAVVALASCATAPPAPSEMVAFDETLSICPRTSVANAPPTDETGAIRGYRPLLAVRGVSLARAPVRACLSSAYGPRLGGAGDFHDGIDLFTGAPRPIGAAAAGRVLRVGEERGYGLTVRIDHGEGVETLYAHLSAAAPISAGDRVVAGERIGATGRSGNASAVHLHFEIRVDGRTIDPLARPGAGA